MDLKKIAARLHVEGLTIEASAAKWVLQWLDRQPDAMQAFEVVIQHLPKSSLSTNVLTTDILNNTISSLAQNVGSELRKHMLVVVPTTNFPHYRYNFARNVFLSVENATLHGDAKDKISMFRYRLGLVRQRMLRSTTFSAPVLRSANADEHLQLTPIDSLLGSTGVRNVLGMLTQLQEGRWYLEDEKANIQVDLSNASITAGLFTEGVVVVARALKDHSGKLEEERFIVEVLGQPPCERKQDTLHAFPNIDFFGAAPPPKLIPHLKEAEKSLGDMFVVLTDVWLDRPEVMHALRRLFAGYDEEPPRAFIFIGNFSSRGVGHASEDSVSFTTHWEQLADLILQHKGISHPRNGSEFIFVPGSGDPSGAVLPRPPIPAHFTRTIRERLPQQVTFTTNPCRIRYGTQELLIFREDLMTKMLRHCIVRPTQETSQSHHLVKTLLDQGHLCPLPLAVRPIHWQLDYTLHLWPLPDIFILADQYESFETDYAGCKCLTMSSFSTEFAFLTYVPGNKEVQWSRLPDPGAEAAAPSETPEPREEPAPKKSKAKPSETSATPQSAAVKGKKKSSTSGGVQQQLVLPKVPAAASAADDRPPSAMNGKSNGSKKAAKEEEDTKMREAQEAEEIVEVMSDALD